MQKSIIDNFIIVFIQTFFLYLQCIRMYVMSVCAKMFIHTSIHFPIIFTFYIACLKHNLIYCIIY